MVGRTSAVWPAGCRILPSEKSSSLATVVSSSPRAICCSRLMGALDPGLLLQSISHVILNLGGNMMYVRRKSYSCRAVGNGKCTGTVRVCIPTSSGVLVFCLRRLPFASQSCIILRSRDFKPEELQTMDTNSKVDQNENNLKRLLLVKRVGFWAIYLSVRGACHVGRSRP